LCLVVLGFSLAFLGAGGESASLVAGPNDPRPAIKLLAGLTNGTNVAGLSFQVEHPGTKKLAKKFLGEIFIGDKKFHPKDCIKSMDDTKTKGTVLIVGTEIPVGVHRVRLTVELDDGTIVSVDARLDFKKLQND
jgi:hypothetical protein